MRLPSQLSLEEFAEHGLYGASMAAVAAPVAAPVAGWAVPPGAGAAERPHQRADETCRHAARTAAGQPSPQSPEIW
ncbi:hypothetical protein A6A06_30695 [Streptomyces sp. CB02923]|nr:hypothetical protein A6A06_30695 [Streptomyces sp. CB02923]